MSNPGNKNKLNLKHLTIRSNDCVLIGGIIWHCGKNVELLLKRSDSCEMLSALLLVLE